MVNMTTAAIMDGLRPQRSAIGPFTRDPNQAAIQYFH
jgi:hypothetical protein